MSRYENLLRRIHAGEIVLIDGATGTEIERRGVPQLDNAWNGGGALSHPQILRAVHRDYIRLGAEVVISNTFATHYHALQDAGVAEHFEDYNRRGVELAIEAREQEQKPAVLVAGGMSYWSWSGNHPLIADLGPAAARQAAVLAAAGADLLIFEMMIDIERMQVLLEAAESTGLPIWVGLTCAPGSDGEICLRDGDRLVDALAIIRRYPVDVVNIMHTEVEYVDASLEALRGSWSGPVGVYAHSGEFIGDQLNFDSTISPADYGDAATRWIKQGAQIIGGCCGIGPGHIDLLAGMVAEQRR